MLAGNFEHAYPTSEQQSLTAFEGSLNERTAGMFSPQGMLDVGSQLQRHGDEVASAFTSGFLSAVPVLGEAMAGGGGAKQSLAATAWGVVDQMFISKLGPVQAYRQTGAAIDTLKGLASDDSHESKLAVSSAIGYTVGSLVVSAVLGMLGTPPGEEAPPNGPTTGGPSGNGSGGGGGIPTLTIDAKMYPNLAENIWNAQQAGRPEVLTYNGPNSPLTILNRRAATEGIPSIPGFTRDEYPFASTREGGAGSWVGHVGPPEHPSGQGAMLQAFYRDNALKAGDQFRVQVINYTPPDP